MRRRLVALALTLTAVGSPAGADPMLGCYAEHTVRLIAQQPAEETCAFVRPGIQVWIVEDDDRSVCQTSYLITGSNGARYLGTEGYCVLSDSDCTELVLDVIPLCLFGDGADTDGPVVYPKGKGFPVELYDGRRIGEVRYAVYETGSRETFSNFALIELDRKVPAAASIRGWGGPTGVERRVTTGAEDVLITSSLTQYEGVAVTGFSHERIFDNVHPQAGISLGGAIQTADGKAVGIVSTISNGNVVERIEPLLRRAGSRLRTRLTVATAPLAR